MADRETVISRLMAVRLPFLPHSEAYEAITDAVVLLENQGNKTGHWIVLEFCANEGIYCSECHMKIFDRTTKPKDKLSRFCPHCGSRNEQFFRDGQIVFR
jgi:Zn finger protein HypA/HybF involved in hydrogenase expression